MERKGIEERYADSVADGVITDILTAAGMVGQEHAIATRAWRLLDCLDSAEYRETLSAYTAMLLRQAKRRRLPNQPTVKEAEDGAKLFLGYLICPVCPTCQGRGASLIGDPSGGRGVLSDCTCPTCAGTARRNLRREAGELGAQMQDLVLWLNGEVLAQSIEAARKIRRKRYA